MKMSGWRPLIFCLAVSGCASEPSHEDAFLLQITCGRTGALIDRALEGAGGSWPAPLADAPEDETPLDIAWRSLRAQAAGLSALKERTCGAGAAPERACASYRPPKWTEASERPSFRRLETLCARLERQAAPFIDAGCAAGRKASGDEMFCSVE